MAESKLTVNVGGTTAQVTINVQPASVAGPKGDKGDKGDPGDANVTVQGIVDALGYTPADAQNVDQLAEDVEDLKQNGGINFVTDDTLTLSADGVLSVNRAHDVEADNTLPVTSAAVYAEVGNINALLATI